MEQEKTAFTPGDLVRHDRRGTLTVVRVSDLGRYVTCKANAQAEVMLSARMLQLVKARSA
jgi:hypothetical protein